MSSDQVLPPGIETFDPVKSSSPEALTAARYSVGYKRPPIHTRFQKGRSGNPRGRPKGAKNYSTLFTRMMKQQRCVTIDGRKQTLSTQEIILLQLVRKAMAGHLPGAQYLLGQMQAIEAKFAPSRDLAINESEPAIEENDRAILAHRQRQLLQDSGLSDQHIQVVLQASGLDSKEVAQ